ncbi:DUF2064 domain-containing protein [Arthrobacter alpinus]|uniref:TIGR04282 family arsenosugar biosynthesis glycosyltransferase n=1 Tax=Arthrobacter alpinus TaxID=656366 RepID=UPI001647B0FD|nr:DUF2064 domain-containing protein [Arthrobacter alpinus]
MSRNQWDLTIAVIAKECLPGKVKTRLTPALTSKEAAELAQVSLSQTLRNVRKVPASRRLLVMEGTPLACDRAGFGILAQIEGGLDERLGAICDGVEGPLLILGMDTPQFTPELLAPLLADWDGTHASFHSWLGLADDGGYWAIALHHPDGRLIRGVRMSTPRTGREQRSRLHAAGHNVGELACLTDVDTFPAALQAAAECRGTPFADAVQALAAGKELP